MGTLGMHHLIPKWRVLSGIIAMALFVTACGTGNTEGDLSTTEPSQQVETDNTANDATTTPLGAVDSVPEGVNIDEICVAAQDEPLLTWYAAQVPDLMDSAVAAFSAEYPEIEIEYLRLASADLAIRYSEERSAGANPASLITNSAPGFFEEGVSQGWFETELDLPALTDWPTEFYDGGNVLLGFLPQYISYNTDLVAPEDVPDGWEDLLDPRWTGQIAILDPQAVFSVLSNFSLQMDEYGVEFLEGLGAQVSSATTSVVPLTETVASGGAAIGVPNVATTVNALAEEGAPIALVELNPTTGSEWGTAVATDGASPNGARCLLNFLMTPDGQAAFNGPFGTPALPGVPGLPVPEGFVRAPFEKAEQDRDTILQALGF